MEKLPRKIVKFSSMFQFFLLILNNQRLLRIFTSFSTFCWWKNEKLVLFVELHDAQILIAKETFLKEIKGLIPNFSSCFHLYNSFPPMVSDMRNFQRFFEPNRCADANLENIESCEKVARKLILRNETSVNWSLPKGFSLSRVAWKCWGKTTSSSAFLLFFVSKNHHLQTFVTIRWPTVSIVTFLSSEPFR